jgi:branched-chain amino acid transport system permease protein
MATEPADGSDFVPHPDLEEMHVIEEHLGAAGKVDAVRSAGGGRGDVVLTVSGLSKRFGGIVATENLDMELRRGTITALVGPNGAGKTTVFNLLTGAIRPDAGEVTWAARTSSASRPTKSPSAAWRVRSRPCASSRACRYSRTLLGVQHQPGELLGQPVRQHPAHDEVRARSARAFARMAHLRRHGRLRRSARRRLAFGQQKLVALARVLATEAEVLLLDEPASGIDFQWVNVMLGLIEQIREQGRTVCIVEHNLHVVERLADHTYFMELGRITAQGSFAELTTDKRLAEAYFGTA